MKKVKLGLIGAGWVARQHLDVIRKIGWIEAVGITSRTKSKAQDLAKEYNIAICSDGAEALLQEAKPDALMVLVSQNQAYNVTSSVIPFGLPLFIEKPAGLTPEENLRLVNLAKKYSVRNMVGFNRRYYSIFHKGLKIIKDHGPLLGVSIEGHERMWRIREGKKYLEEVMTNWIFANSTHTIDLLRFFGGEPKEIKSIAHRYVEKNGDQFASIMELESGAIGQYNAHWYSPGGWRVILYGKDITVEFKPLEEGWYIDKKLNDYKIEPDEVDIKYKAGFYKQMEAFGRLISDGCADWPLLDLEGSYKTMILAEELTKNLSDKSNEIRNGKIKW